MTKLNSTAPDPLDDDCWVKIDWHKHVLVSPERYELLLEEVKRYRKLKEELAREPVTGWEWQQEGRGKWPPILDTPEEW